VVLRAVVAEAVRLAVVAEAARLAVAEELATIVEGGMRARSPIFCLGAYPPGLACTIQSSR
jgi:hypothetical protein